MMNGLRFATRLIEYLLKNKKLLVTKIGNAKSKGGTIHLGNNMDALFSLVSFFLIFHCQPCYLVQI